MPAETRRQRLLHPRDLQRLCTAEDVVVVIDVRTPGEFAGRHIPGSYNVPLFDLAEHGHELAAAHAPPVVLVCESGRRAAIAEARLAEQGLARVHVLEGGIVAWEAQGLPLRRIAEASAPWTLERQVRLVAGGIVATAVASSVVWAPARFVAGAVGAGLVFAALTDTCTMGAALSRLPWNRRRVACDLLGGAGAVGPVGATTIGTTSN